MREYKKDRNVNEWMIISNALDPVSMNKLERIYHLQLALLNSQFTHYHTTFSFLFNETLHGDIFKVDADYLSISVWTKITGFRLDFSIDFILTIINEKKRNKMLLRTDTQHLMETAINWNDECYVCAVQSYGETIFFESHTSICCDFV